MLNDEHRYLELVLWVVCILFIVGCCAGCLPSFVKDFAEEVDVACGAALNQEGRAKDPYLRGMHKTARKVSDKIGTTGKSITEDNVLDRLEQTGVEADEYVPWWKQITTGNSLIDMLIMLVCGGGVYAGRNPLRRGLHLLTHNAKENVDEVAKS